MALFNGTRKRLKKADTKGQKVSPGTAKAKAAVSGIRGVGSGIVGTLLANQVRASAGKAGLAGVAAGLAFNVLLKRNPVGAVLFGGAILVHQAYRSGKDAQARQDAKKALERGALAAPDDRRAVKLRSLPA